MSIETPMTYEDCARQAVATLSHKYPVSEARWMTRLIFEHLKGYSPTDMIIHGQQPVSDFIAQRVDKTVSRVMADEPLQYVLGTARFYGMDFKVTPAVLIPRPETETLVDAIVDRYGHTSDLGVLDLGTGSGCIAISLARNLPFARVEAVDISPTALDVARENATDLRVKIAFRQADILTLSLSPDSYDIIVSNPPYICDSERASMARNVLDHEPATALFVPDNDPLRFYRAISRIGRTALVSGGTLWLEINPLHADETASMLRSDGWHDVTLMPDERALQRFICATNPDD